MMKNFILKMATEVRCHNYSTKPLAPKLEKEERKVYLAQDEVGFAIYDEYTRRLEQQIKSGADLLVIEAELGRPIDVYKHSGLAIRKDRLARTAAQNSINRYPTVREYGNSPQDSAFLKTQDKQSIRRHSQVYKDKVKAAYDKCYPDSGKERSRTTDHSQKNKQKSIVEEERGNNFSLDVSEIKAPITINEVKDDKKVLSYKVHSFVEREYARRNTQHLKRIEKTLVKQKKVLRASSGEQISKSHNSSHEKSDVIQSYLDL